MFFKAQKKVLRLFQSRLVFAGIFREMPRYVIQGKNTGASNSYFRQISFCLVRVLPALFDCAVEGFCRHFMEMPPNLFLAQGGDAAEPFSGTRWKCRSKLLPAFLQMPPNLFSGI
jgi:hypothetical protein